MIRFTCRQLARPYVPPEHILHAPLVNASGKQVIDEQTLETGTRTELFKSRSFRTNFGNDNVQMIVNGKSYRVAASPDPIGYSVRPGREPRRLSDDARPDCSS